MTSDDLRDAVARANIAEEALARVEALCERAEALSGAMRNVLHVAQVRHAIQGNDNE